MKKIFIITIALVSATLFAGCSAHDKEDPEGVSEAVEDSAAKKGDKANSTTSQLIPSLTYSLDNPQIVQFNLENKSSGAVELNFKSSQRYDFTLTNEATQEVHQDSTNSFYAMALEKDIIEKGDKLVYDLSIPSSMETGTYHLSVWLMSNDDKLNESTKTETVFEYTKK